MNELLIIRDLVAGYKYGEVVLHGVSLNLVKGEAVGVLGLNGSGKSTLGKAIVNMLPYRTGNVIYCNQPINDIPTHQLRHMGISYMGQGGTVFNNLSVAENLQMSGMSMNRLEELALNISLLRQPLRWMRKTMADKLSGGQRMQLALSMTFAFDSQLVILDEPSAGLSPRAIDEMYSLLSKLRQSAFPTILLIEQAVGKAVGFCDRCVVMESGNVMNIATSASLADIENKYFKSNTCFRQNMIDSKMMWDKIYVNHCEDAPWMLEEYSNQLQTLIEGLIDMSSKGQHILEYGCGNGKVALHLQQSGMRVDMVDISHVLIEYLHQKYESSGMSIFEADTPYSLTHKSYDVVIVWCVLHHLHPDTWKYFIDGFGLLLKKGGLLIIGGWDNSDVTIHRDNNIALFTQQETWFINSMRDVIDRQIFSIVDSDVFPIKNPLFSEIRRFRYYKLVKTN